MNILEIYNKEEIEEYINMQLKNKKLSIYKRRELKMVKDLYIKCKERKEIISKYSISKATLCRIEKRFYKAYENGEIYADIKLNSNKLTDSQKEYIYKVLSKEPIENKLPYFYWDKVLLKEYIKMKFNVDYSERQCNNILNSNKATTNNTEVVKYINQYSNRYVLDVLFIHNKNNYKNLLKKQKQYKNIYLGKEYEKNIYTALFCNDKTFAISESFETSYMYKDIILEFISLFRKSFGTKTKAIIVIEAKELSLEEALELNMKYRNIKFIYVVNINIVEDIIISDVQYIKQNILKQKEFIDFSYRGRYKEKINRIINEI